MHIPTSASHNHWLVWLLVGDATSQSRSGIQSSSTGESGRSAHSRTTSRRLQLLSGAVGHSHWPLLAVHTYHKCTLVIDMQPSSRTVSLLAPAPGLSIKNDRPTTNSSTSIFFANFDVNAPINSGPDLSSIPRTTIATVGIPM
ncbi:hypothetical protein K449DRAFT_25039 [Hypoxylon sp. EC38]|nr:hypothetical protein K449DRAFT_25039 [Hypoxylon sp. EC38]